MSHLKGEREIIIYEMKPTHLRILGYVM